MSDPRNSRSRWTSASVNGQIFVFAAERLAGTEVYEFDPRRARLQYVTGMSGTYFARVSCAGRSPSRRLFITTASSPSESYIDIYDTKWITEGGSPLRRRTIPRTARRTARTS